MTSKLPETTQPSTIRTFLIADIRGWTRFTRELGDEAASRLASKFAQIVGEGVEAWGGRLLELRGDEAMCTFESARRALHCAVELQEAFTDESALAPELPLNVGIGLDAGEAVPVGDGYRGTALNVAARLCAAAAAGEVIATGSLAHLAGRVDGLTFADLDAKPMKGFDQPVPAVLVDSATPHEHDDPVDHSASAGTTPPLPPELDPVVPLIARDAELRWLSWHWRRARHGHGGVVGLTGVAGIGCTRLVAELATMGHREGAVVAYLRGEESPVPPDDASLVIIDDLERLPSRRSRALFRGLATGLDRRLLVVIEHVRDRGADTPAVESLIASDRVHRLGPIDVDGVIQISRLYLDEPGTDVPAQLLLEESDGIPAEVHRVASQWARATASRRLGESARRTSRERRELRAAEAAMVDDVERLETARERSRLFVPLADPATDEPSAAPLQVCPYKGLAAFDAADADYFFGRERLIAELVARMVGSSFIGLVGASGSGKSSTLQAGLLPSLAGGVIPGSDQWIQVPMRPGEHPMAELQSSLTRHLAGRPTAAADPASMIDAVLAEMRPAQRLLVIVDQFEELFQVRDDEERAEFVDVLTTPRAGMKVLVSLRADHYERCAAYPRLARLIGAEQVLVGPLTADELRSVIRHPAERVGLRVDAELIDALVADVTGEPGGLPLLSTALLELWEARDDGRMTLAAYRVTGGVRGAVARLAEGVYGRLEAEQQAVARTIFLRLAGEGEGGAIVRRRVRIEELDVADRPETAETLAALTTGRLVTATDGFVEVAHEALLREWPRLRGWIEEDSAGRQLRLHLVESARTWDEGGREEGDLYRGARLASVLDWTADHAVELNAVEREFVQTSREASQREAERQRRTNRILRGALGVAAVLLVVALGAGWFAATQAQRADDERRLAVAEADRAEQEAARAEEHATLARARELYASSIAVLGDDPELTIHLAREARALGVDPYPEAVSALHEAVRNARTITNIQFAVRDVQPVTPGVALSPDGRRLYTSQDTRSVLIYDVATGALLDTLGTPAPMREAVLTELTLAQDGSQVAVTDEDAVVHVWDLATRTETTYQAAGEEPGNAVFSPDGLLLATTTFLDTGLAVVEVWDLQMRERIREWRFEFMFSIAFHPDGDRILGTACPCAGNSAVILLDIRTGEESVPVDDVEGIQQSSPTSAYFNPDASLLATAGQDGKVHLWDAQSGDHVREFVGHTDPVQYIAFDPAGERVATTSVDGTTRVWDVSRGTEMLRLAGQGGSVGYASFSADGRTLATGSSNMTLRVWDVAAPVLADVKLHNLSLALETASAAEHPHPTLRRVIDLKQRDRLVAVLARPCFGFCPGAAMVLDLDSGQATLVADMQVGAGVGLSNDGRLLWTQGESEDGGPSAILAHDLSTGHVFELEGICESVPEYESCIGLVQAKGFTVTNDGSRVVGVGFSLHGDPTEPDAFAWIASWSAVDGSLLTVRPMDDDEYFFPVFSPDEDILAVAGKSEDVRLLHPETLEEVARLEMIQPRRLAFSSDGSLLAAASDASETTVFNVVTGDLIHRFRPSFDVDFAEDGTQLLTADADRVVRLWSMASGAEIQAIPGAADIAQFLNGERHYLTAAEGHIAVMTLDLDELFEIGAGRLSRNMTDAECEKYLGATCER